MFRITVEPDTAYILNIDWNEEDDVMLQSFLSAITSGKDSWLEQSQYLGSSLLKGITIPEHPQRMLILSDGFLHAVPFDILSIHNQDSSRLLIEGFEIYHSPSLKALFIEYPEVETQGIATFAPDYFGEPVQEDEANVKVVWNDLVRSNTLKLPGAMKEAIELKDMLRSDLFVGKDATAANFSEVAGRYNVLHLAMHAVCEFESPIFSRLIFQGEGEDDNSRFCYASQIANMDIPADMVVLSACNTGSGQFIPGEGISSIARSFQYAGTKSSVYSLWKVPDVSTPDLMKNFYQYLKEGMDKPAALRKAKLSFIEQTSESAMIHPMYWAGFVVNGLPDPLELPGSDRHWYTVLGLGILLLSVLIYFLVFRSKP